VRIAVLAVLGLAAVAAAPVAQAGPGGPSFDCRKARTWVEKTICGDPVLADKDQRMAMAYRDLVDQAREGGGPAADLSSFQDEQRAWLRERNRCRTRACIEAAYDRRIGEVTVD
jgi:uncharacterized protein